jgi:hypothetical protein
MNDDDRQESLAQLEHLKSLAERAYGDMYETGSASGAAACYSEARVCYRDAIRLAVELGLAQEAEKLNRQMDLLASAFRGQFG